MPYCVSGSGAQWITQFGAIDLPDLVINYFEYGFITVKYLITFFYEFFFVVCVSVCRRNGHDRYVSTRSYGHKAVHLDYRQNIAIFFNIINELVRVC